MTDMDSQEKHSAEMYSPEEIFERLRSPDGAEHFSSLGGMPYCLLDLRGKRADNIHSELALLLAALNVPVISLCDTPLPAVLEAAVDCVLDDEKVLAPILRNITSKPIAAMSLVQLSKAVEQLDTMAALDMESVTYACLQGGSEYALWLQHYQPEPLPPESDQDPVLLERVGDSLTITLNRPELRNSISVEMRDALVEALSLVVMDNSLEHLVLQGAGKCFSVGGELREFGYVPNPATGHAIRSQRLPGRWLARVASRCEARVHGACIGAGVELPAFAKRVVAAENAYFQLPEIQFGLIPGAGGCVSIARRIGRHRFNQLALSGKRINAALALDWGLVDAVEA